MCNENTFYTGTDPNIIQIFMSVEESLNLLHDLRQTYLAEYKASPCEEKRERYLIHDNLVKRTTEALKVLTCKSNFFLFYIFLIYYKIFSIL